MISDANLPAGAGPHQAPLSVDAGPVHSQGSLPAGHPNPEPLVDPVVARAKFDRQVADYRRMEREYLKRGWLMVRAEFPEVVVLFAAPHLSPPGVLFGVVIDFTNFDLWAPSVRFVEPFTLEPLPAHRAPAVLKRAAPQMQPAAADAAMPGGQPADGNSPAGAQGQPFIQGFPPGMQVVFQAPQHQNLVQAHPGGLPFLCMAGIREYHEHPFHSDDPWLAHRDTGVGTLQHILDVIHRHGVLTLKQWNFEIAMQVQVVGIEQDLGRVPG
jgi:hypothetical protein